MGGSNAKRAALARRPFDTHSRKVREDYLFAGAALAAEAAEDVAIAASEAAEEAAIEASDAAADASEAAASAEAALLSVLFAAPWQATTERAATAAPATRILRRASEVIVPGPLEGGCCADQCAGGDYAVILAKGKHEVHESVIDVSIYPSAGMAPRCSSSSKKLGCDGDGTLPRPISTEIWAAFPCR